MKKIVKLHGFTLVELLLAISIFGVIAASTFTIFDAQKKLSNESIEVGNRSQLARTLLKLIEDDIMTSYLSPYYKIAFLGLERRVDTLAINNHPREGSKEIDLTRTIYFEGPNGGIYRHKRKHLTEPTIFKDVEAELIHDMSRIRFRYFDGTDWYEIYDTSQTGMLPKAVEVTVEIKGIEYTRVISLCLSGIGFK